MMLLHRVIRHIRPIYHPPSYSFTRMISTHIHDIETPSQDISTTPLAEITHTEDDIITYILNKQDALNVLSILSSHTDTIWACDTEVADIDFNTQGPVGHGKVTCVSIYGGPHIDFGDGKGGTLWIENIDASCGILQEFKEWFENPIYKKVWHNYGFDRHVMYNEGIDCKGFAGDTMHMARLWNSSLNKTEGSKNKGYSLESLTNLLYPMDSRFSKIPMKKLFSVPKQLKSGTLSKVTTLPSVWELQRDPAHRQLWIKYSARDAVATWWLHHALEKNLMEEKWIVEDVVLGTMYDYYELYLRRFGELLTDMERAGIKVDAEGHVKQAEVKAREERAQYKEMFIEWAAKHVTKDAHLLNIASTSQIQQILFGTYKNRELICTTKSFMLENSSSSENPDDINAPSNPYAGKLVAELKKLLKDRGLQTTGKKSELVARLLEYDQKESSSSNDDSVPKLSPADGRAPSNPYADKLVAELKKLLKDRGLQTTGKKSELVARLLEYDQKVSSSSTDDYDDMDYDDLCDVCNSMGLNISGDGNTLRARIRECLYGTAPVNESVNVRKVQESFLPQVAPKKNSEVVIETIGLTPNSFTPSGAAKVSIDVLMELAGHDLFGDEKDAVWGKAYDKIGKEGCRALGALAKVAQVDTMITNFLVPLQAMVDDKSRVHCSLNLNTETGRLSARRPNLQNQPALEKDQYKIRDAFVAEEGCALIVADYGQLELRLLAHITQCESMLQAFESGGCFHSRTAMGMYPYIREAVESGKVLLEWDYSKGDPPCPLVKDVYASERRKAKTLNFSIAYGKTVHGLAQDWGISKEEATDTLEAWYADRPEVKNWQTKMKAHATRFGYVRTLMGRCRHLPEATLRQNRDSEMSGTMRAAIGRAMRAAINTPIQGSAADVVIMAMLKLWDSEKLQKLGWKLVLQIHDEVILEGPKESSAEAMAEVKSCMESPFDNFGLSPLRVKLEVDAKCADSWYKAK